MEDKQDTVSQQETTQALLEPIGVRVIGEVDPRTLTEEQFRNSPNLLFHGAKEDFVFSRDFDYENFQNPGGFTIGAGFYTTDNEEEARWETSIEGMLLFFFLNLCKRRATMG